MADPTNDAAAAAAANTAATDDGLTDGERAALQDDDKGAAAGADAGVAAGADAGAAAADAAAAADPNPGKDAATLAAEQSLEVQRALKGSVDALTSALTPARTAAAAAEPEREPDWDAQKAELRKQLDAGTIDEDEYDAEREKLLEKKFDWRNERQIEERLQQENAQRADNDWKRAQAVFAVDKTNADFLADPVRKQAFHANIQAAADANPAGTYADWLVGARDMVLKAFGATGVTKTPQQIADEIEKAKRERAAGAGAPAPNLAKAPAAGGAAAGAESAFASLDNLDVSSLEDRLAKMTSAQQAAYLEDAPGGLRDNPRG